MEALGTFQNKPLLRQSSYLPVSEGSFEAVLLFFLHLLS